MTEKPAWVQQQSTLQYRTTAKNKGSGFFLLFFLKNFEAFYTFIVRQCDITAKNLYGSTVQGDRSSF